MNIRLATFDDIPAILAISNHYALTTPANFAIEPEPLEHWQRDFVATRDKYPWLVAEEESTMQLNPPHPLPPSQGERGNANPLPLSRGERGVVVGFAKASPWKGRCAYAYAAETTVYVAPGLQRRGVGRMLYSTLIQALERQGYRTLLGGITLPNDASVGLHEALGFRKVAELERIGWKFQRWHNVGYWEKTLGNASAPPGIIKSVTESLQASNLDCAAVRHGGVGAGR